MRRLPMLLAAAGAAALTALAMTVSAPAIGGASDKPGVPATAPASEEQLRTCLEQHGASIEGDDPAAVKRWVLAHGDDAEARDAMKACNLASPATKPADCGDGKHASPPPGRPRLSEDDA